MAVTGAGGVIGTALCSRLLQDDKVELFPVYNLGQIVLDDDPLPEVDVIIHLSEPSVASEVHEIAREMNVRKLKKLVSHKGCRIIYASSAAVYGDEYTCKCSESNLTVANSEYVRSKVECEKIVLDHGGTVFRLGNVYGPSPKVGTVLNVIIQQFKFYTGEIRLFNKTSVRDFVWIEDVVDCFAKAIHYPNTSGVFNLGSGEGTSVSQIIRQFSIFARKTPSVMELSPLSKSSYLVLDTRKMFETFGWCASTKLSDGLRKYWNNS